MWKKETFVGERASTPLPHWRLLSKENCHEKGGHVESKVKECHLWPSTGMKPLRGHRRPPKTKLDSCVNPQTTEHQLMMKQTVK